MKSRPGPFSSKTGVAAGVVKAALYALVRAGAGHAEPAAGVVGLLALAAALEGRRTAPLLHLRTLNPHVGGALGGGHSGHRGLQIQMPRTGAAMGDTAGQQSGEPLVTQHYRELGGFRLLS